MQWVNTYITVKDSQKAIDYYTSTFGFELAMTMPGEDGSIMHAELRYKDCVMMLGPECAEHDGMRAPSTLGATSVGFYLYVDDVDSFFEKVKASGATVHEELDTKFWGDRTCSFIDPEGHSWSFAQNVADFDPSKVPGAPAQ
jgi:PhnB protein